MNDRIVAALFDNPQDDDWTDVSTEAARALRTARTIGVGNRSFTEKDIHDRRGDFLKIPVGISTGGGQKVRPIVVSWT
jgi:hypothetical protein